MVYVLKIFVLQIEFKKTSNAIGFLYIHEAPVFMNFFDVAPGRFTAPVDGTYYFSCNAVMTDDIGDLYIIRESNGVLSDVCSVASGNDPEGRLDIIFSFNTYNGLELFTYELYLTFVE